MNLSMAIMARRKLSMVPNRWKAYIWTRHTKGMAWLSPEVHQHLGDGGGRQEDVDQGQVGEEEVHGCVEVGVCDVGQDDEQVSQDGDQVHERNSPEEDLML